MATKRIATTAINWEAISERVIPSERNNFIAFRVKSEGYLKRLIFFPVNPPKFDWDFYKKKVPIAGMVDNFKKTYESMEVPYPIDNYTKLINEQEKEIKANIVIFKANSAKKKKEYQSELDFLKSFLPFDKMTMEDFKDAYPDIALDTINNPTFWPHDKDEQIDYRDKKHPLYGTDPHGGH